MPRKIVLTEQQEIDMEKFIKFLKKHKALTKFKNNLKQRGFNDVKTIKKLCSIRKPFDFLLLSFDWHMSLQGVDYWLDLNQLWYGEGRR